MTDASSSMPERGPVILLAGDDDPLGDAIARALALAGASVGRATRVRAPAAAFADRPDAILLLGDALADRGDAIVRALVEPTVARTPVLLLEATATDPRMQGARRIASLARTTPEEIAVRTMALARELAPGRRSLGPVRIRTSITTARFGAVTATDVATRQRQRRQSRLKLIFRAVGEGASLSDVPAPIVPPRRRAQARAMRLPKNRIELEPSTSVKKTETDLRVVPTMVLPRVADPRRRWVLPVAVLLAFMIVGLAMIVHQLRAAPEPVGVSLAGSPP